MTQIDYIMDSLSWAILLSFFLYVSWRGFCIIETSRRKEQNKKH